jgi:F-type H+-transporting ATPase subunit gamma
MANPRLLLKRRTSVIGTRKITRTMELVASAKLKKAQDAAGDAQPYAEGLSRLVQRLVTAGGAYDLPTHPLMQQRTPQRILLLVASSDRGLCGTFNINLVRAAIDRIHQHQTQERTVTVYSLGRKGASTLRFLGHPVDQEWRDLLETPQFPRIQEVIDPILHRFEDEQFDRVEVVYNRFISIANLEPKVMTLLPSGLAEERPRARRRRRSALELRSSGGFLYHPAPEHLLAALVPQTVRTAFFSCLLQTAAGAHAARRVAMKNATDAAGEIIDHLSRAYNRARQGKITQEIAEIVGAVEAMG